MTQQLLHNFGVFSICFQESCVGAPERVPADSLLNSKIPHNRLEVVTHTVTVAMAGTVKTKTEHSRTDKSPKLFMRFPFSMLADAFERASLLAF